MAERGVSLGCFVGSFALRFPGTSLSFVVAVECLDGRGFFLRGGFGCCAARAVKAGAAAGALDDLFIDVGVVNHTCVHPGHGPVIAEPITNPSSAVVALSPVAVAVIDPAVEPNGRAPVALVEEVIAAVVAPVSGSPQESDARRRDPDARY